MRFQGKISQWKDDKGFGFVTPNGGGQQAFIHINAFTPRGRRPIDGDVVSFEVAYDGMGRPQAENVRYYRALNQRPSASGRSSMPLWTGGLFVLCMALGAAAGKVPLLLCAWYGALSLAAYIAYWTDKTAARQDRWRTPENTLHLLGLAGGWPGALAAQYVLRHKSKKASFLAAFWVTVAVNAGALAWLLRADAAAGLRGMLHSLPGA